MKVLWLERAQADLDAIFDYLIDRDREAAARVRREIGDGVGLLADFPGLGRVGRVHETRELAIAGTPFIVAYTVDRRMDAVIVLRVLARRWPDSM